MEKIFLRILIFEESHACEGPSNALGLLGQFLLLWLGSLLAHHKKEILLERYLVTLPHCDPVPMKSLWVHWQQIQQPQVSKHQTTRQKQLPKGFRVCPCWQDIWIAKHCSCAILSCLWPDVLLALHSATEAAASWEGTQIFVIMNPSPVSMTWGHIMFTAQRIQAELCKKHLHGFSK